MATNSNRRYKLGYLFVALITVAFYIAIFKGLPLEWYVSYSKDMLWWFAAIAGVLTATDIAGHVKDIFNSKNGGTK